ncbi:hypothetical protein D3C71_2224520 [compost metagenome]
MFIRRGQVFLEPAILCCLALSPAVTPGVNGQVVDKFVDGEQLQQLVLSGIGTRPINTRA